MQANLLNSMPDQNSRNIWATANRIDHDEIRAAISRATSTLRGITVTQGGSGYTSPPTITIGPPDTEPGTQATAQATFSGSGSNVQLQITITNVGLGYTFPPSVTFSGGGGSGLAAVAVVNHVTLNPYIVDPIPMFDLDQWFTNHQQLHQDALNTLKIQSTDLENVDMNDPRAMQEYLWLHWLDHVAMRNALAGYI